MNRSQNKLSSAGSIAGPHWNVPEYRTPEHMRLLTETMKRIHALHAMRAIEVDQHNDPSEA